MSRGQEVDRSGTPAPARAHRPDHTGLVVLLGIVLLAIVGVGTVFGETLMGILAPPAPDESASGRS